MSLNDAQYSTLTFRRNLPTKKPTVANAAVALHDRSALKYTTLFSEFKFELMPEKMSWVMLAAKPAAPSAKE